MRFSPLAPLALIATLAAPLAAHDYKAGALTIDHPWTRQTAPGQSVGAAYMAITNKGARADQLLGASSPEATRVEIHSMSMDGGVMRMRALRDGLTIPARASISLAPGGYHIMLFGLKAPFAPGGRIPLELRFRRAGTVKVILFVKAIGTQQPEASHAGH